MAQIDRERWDERWALRSARPFPQPNPLLLRYQAQLSGGMALELACGLGENALWLAEHDYHVTGVDISAVALERGQFEAQSRGLQVDFVAADLDNYVLPQNAFDVVSVFRFLDRSLFPAIERALRPDGWLFYETFNVRRKGSHPHMQYGFLLELGELVSAFASLDVVETADDGELSYLVGRRR